MKWMLLVLALIATLPAFAESSTGEQPSSIREQMHKLLLGLPQQQELTRYERILKHPESAQLTGDLLFCSDIEYARKMVKLAQDRIPKIRALLQNGASVFDYPGLLAIAGIEYSVLKKLPDGTLQYGYQLYLGASMNEAYSEPWFLHLITNDRGVITMIDSVDAKQLSGK